MTKQDTAMREQADVFFARGWLLSDEPAKTVCVVGQRAPDPFAVGSTADKHTASCRTSATVWQRTMDELSTVQSSTGEAPPADMFAIDMFANSLSRPRFDAERIAQAFAADPFFQLHPASDDR